MNIREFINKKGRWIAPVLVVVAGATLFFATRSFTEAPADQISKAYFSDDDGKSHFTDDVGKPSPFDRNGKPAYRAYVFRCGSGAPFVAFLGRYAAPPGGTGGVPSRPDYKRVTGQGGQAAAASVPEIKKPGDTKWVSMLSSEGQALAAVKCPDGAPAQAVMADD